MKKDLATIQYLKKLIEEEQEWIIDEAESEIKNCFDKEEADIPVPDVLREAPIKSTDSSI